MNPCASGTEIGPYVLVAAIGSGGVGEVWKARDTRLDRIVAIKRLKGQHNTQFEQEARAIAEKQYSSSLERADEGSLLGAPAADRGHKTARRSAPTAAQRARRIWGS